MTAVSGTEVKRLVDRTRRGDEAGFSALVDRYIARVYAVAFARTFDPSDVDDVVQDTFITALRSIRSLRDAGRFEPWVLGIARNTASQYNRKRERRDRLHKSIDPPDKSVADKLTRAEVQEIVHAGIDDLKPQHREVIMLHYFAGLTPDEIAEAAGITTDAAYKRLQRARAALGEALLAYMEPVSNDESSQLTKRVITAVAAAGGLSQLIADGTSVVSSAAMLTIAAAGIVIAAGAYYGITSFNTQPTDRTSEVFVAETEEPAPDPNPPGPSPNTSPPGPAPTAETIESAQDEPPAEPEPEPLTKMIPGRVVFTGGSPVPGALVMFEIMAMRGFDITSITNARMPADEDGRFEIPVKVGGSTWVHAKREPTARRISDRYAVSEDSEEVVLTLEPPYQISGQIVDAITGEPIPNAEIGYSTSISRRRIQQQPVQYIGQADENGDFSQVVDYQSAYVFARAPGYAPAYVQYSGLSPNGNNPGYQVALEPSLIVQGVVVTKDGTPIAGAGIWIGESAATSLAKRDDPDVLTDELGRFYLDSIPRNAVRLSAYLEGFATKTIPIPSDGQPITIEMTAGASIGVYVVDGRTPLAEETVKFEGSDFRIQQGMTDGNGYVLFTNVPAGAAQITSRVYVQDIVVQDGQYAEVTFDRRIESATVKGLLTFNGEPMANTWGRGLRLDVVEPDIHTFEKFASTDAAGYFEFKDVIAGNFVLQFRKTKYDTIFYQRGFVRKGQTLDLNIDLTEGASIRGKVSNLKKDYRNVALIFWGDEPLADRDGSLHSWRYNEMRHIDNFELRDDGEFYFHRVQPNVYTIAAVALPEESTQGHQQAYSDTVIAQVENGQDLEFEFDLDNPRE